MKITETVEFDLGTDSLAEARRTVKAFVRIENCQRHEINSIPIKIGIASSVKPKISITIPIELHKEFEGTTENPYSGSTFNVVVVSVDGVALFF